MERAFGVIMHEPGADGVDLLDRALSQVGLARLAAETVGPALSRTGQCSAIILPALDGFALGSPAVANPALVEHLLDRLFDLGVTEAAVGSTCGSDALWLENREVFMAADLLGYRYRTPGGRDYDVIDLAEDVVEDAFPEGCALAGTGLSRVWLEADLRVVFAANRTDEDDGYALCLSTLLSALPLTDKDYHYRYRRDPGQVVAALVDVAPPHLAIIDATVSGHGPAGRRAPIALRTDTVIAADDPARADYLGALKMGLDPYVSQLATISLRRLAAPANAAILGSLSPYLDWINVDPALVESTAARRAFPMLDRAVRPILQQVDRSLFPFRSPANDWLNNALAGSAVDGPLLTVANLWLGGLGSAVEAYGVLAGKDGLRRREAPINIDLVALRNRDYDLAGGLLGQAATLAGAAADSDGLRWRYDDGAIMFDAARRFPIPFEEFTTTVEIHKTIQFMNDYIGGQAVATRRDRGGRVTRQVERNLYLPQPNYTAIGGGVVIDVTKIETVDYAPRRQRMFWKTVKSENDSALADDGVVTFEALGEDTLVTIWGRQHFRLPPIWAEIDRNLPAAIRHGLVSQAYGRFFDRTFANLEAVAERRDIRIGRSWSDASEGEPLLVERLSALVKDLQSDNRLRPRAVIEKLLGRGGEAAPTPRRIDDDGFRHFEGPPPARAAPSSTALSQTARDLRLAIDIDLRRAR